ncbi:trehalose-phosphatase [soil metagenome]
MPAASRSEKDLAPIDELRALAPSVALLFDVDGTLAPIVEKTTDAAITSRVRDALYGLTRHYTLVGCVSGRRALDARRIVGLDELHYIGNHGFEELEPGAARPRPHPALGPGSGAVAEFVSTLPLDRLLELGVEVEDKDLILGFHWRAVADPEEAEERLGDLAARAEAAGLVTHWGRRMLELRPGAELDKGTAIDALLRANEGLKAGLFIGDDRTDLDGFSSLRRAQAEGVIERAVCVGVVSDEGPAEIVSDADIAVEFDEVVTLIARLGEV